MKSRVADLALFGGEPLFEEPLHVGCPYVGDREALLKRINDVLDRKWLTNNGPLVQEFEKRVADRLQVKHCVATCNGTVALEIAIRALGMSGEVIVPSFTFVATAHALEWQGITPIFVDIDPSTHTLDPRQVGRLITPRTSGIIGVHLWGRPCEVEVLAETAAAHDLRLLFDASHAFGCSDRGRLVGGFGDAEVFSFHATKFVNSFEGGAITTENDGLAAKIRLMKNFGFSGYDNVVHLGVNGKMSEVAAAMGLTSLESMDELISLNSECYETYRRGLSDLPGIRFFSFDSSQSNNYQYIVLECDESIAGLGREHLVKVLHAERVLARRYFYPGCHRMEPYRSYYPNAGLLLPETERIADRVLCLPNGSSVDRSDVEQICSLIRMVLEAKDEVMERFHAAEAAGGVQV